MRKRERCLFTIQFKLQSDQSEFFKKNQNIRTKILIPSYCVKIKVRADQCEVTNGPPNNHDESKSINRKEQSWAEIVLEIES